MEIVSLSSTTFIGLSTVYGYDPTLKYKENIIFTEEGLEFPQVGSFEQLNDITVNNFSLLYLTKQQPLSSNLYVKPLERLDDEGFSTYLVTNAINSITPFSKYWVVEEPAGDDTTAQVALTGEQAYIDNRYFFDIYFRDENTCLIAHENNKTIKYLTVDYLGNVIFAPWGNYDYLADASPQVFYYIYDRESDFIVFHKNEQDISKYLAYNSSENNLLLVDPITGTETPYPSLAIFRCRPRNEAPNETKLYDSWVTYDKNFKTNSLDVNENAGTPLVDSNMLVNAQYYNITGNDIPTNILSLKNTNTPENFQYRNNPFQIEKKPDLFVENEFNSRDYKKIFSGSNQLYGNDNITLGYQSFTTDIILKKDSVTYFHMPQNTYPFIQLNIAQSGLTKAGAIAGDHPLKSDKIFKKLGNYKYTSHFGETIDEATGSFLCSWLSGCPNTATEPIWVDRYYNPSKVSFFSALTTNPYQSIEYKTVFECLAEEVAEILKNVTVFDKPSDLIFEPGTYYAYHHYGPNDVKKYISSMQRFLVQKGFSIYKQLDGVDVLGPDETTEEITFDGSSYASTGSLSAIQDSGQFTLGFYMHSYDWSKPFAGQIIGNFASDGFGIFNQNTITPTIYVPTFSGFEVFNTSYTNIKTLPYSSPPQAIIRPDGISNYFVIHKDGYWRKYNASDSLVQEVYNSAFAEVLWYDTTEIIAYVLCKIPGNRRIIRVDMRTGQVDDITSSITGPGTIANFIRAANDPERGWNTGAGLATLFRQASTVDYLDDIFYITPGTISSRVNNTLFYLKNNNTIMRWDELDRSTPLPATTAFKSYTNINDFEVDYDDNIWILADDHKYFKYTTDRKFLLSGSFGTKNNDGTLTYDQYTNYNVGFIADFEDGEYYRRVVITRRGREKQPAPAGFPHLSALSAEYFDFKILTTDGELLQSVKFKAMSGECIFDPTNSDWLRRFVKQAYPETYINAKAVLANVFDINDTYKIDLVYDLSVIDPGYHHFAVRFDSYNGLMYLFVDGQEVKKAEFPPRKYKFSQFVTRPFLIGTSSFTNSIPLYQYLKKNSSLAADITIKNFYLYFTPLNYFDLAFLTREGMDINDIHFNVPCGQRNYLEEIERYFKATIPGRKSEFFNIKIKNSGITDPVLRNTLEERIKVILQQSAPAYSQLNTIKWD